MKPFAVLMAAAILGMGISVSAAAPPQPLMFQMVYSDGKDVLLTRQVPVGGEPIKQQYTVKIPIKTNNGIEYRNEVRTRMVRRTKEVRSPATEQHQFSRLDGTKLSHEELASQIPKTGKPVISLVGKTELPLEWYQLLRKDAVIMRFNPAPFDDEQR